MSKEILLNIISGFILVITIFSFSILMYNLKNYNLKKPFICFFAMIIITILSVFVNKFFLLLIIPFLFMVYSFLIQEINNAQDKENAQ